MSATQAGKVDATRRLLQLLSQKEDGASIWPPADRWDWRPFAEACELHGVTPYVYHRLQSLPETVPPAGLLEFLRTSFHAVCARNYELAKNLVDLTAKLQAEGIPSLAYKGPSLAMAAYGGLSLRHYDDLDVVIHREHLMQAVRLMTHWGFRGSPTPGRSQIIPYWVAPDGPRHVARAKDIPLLAPDSSYYVELHWRLGDRFWLAFSPAVEKLWERSVRIDLPQGSVPTMCPEDLLLALCAHGTRHRWGTLKWLLDIVVLLRNAGELDWSRLEEMVRIRPGVAKSFSVALILAHDLLDDPLPTEAERILLRTDGVLSLASAIREELLSNGQTDGSPHRTLLAMEERPLVRLEYQTVRILHSPGNLFRGIFVKVNPHDRAFTRLPFNRHFLYHLVRPLRLIGKHTARVLRNLWSMTR
jgi:hypothetical protein